MDIEDTVENLAGRVIDLEAQTKEDQARIAELEYHVKRLEGHWAMEAELRNHDDAVLGEQITGLSNSVDNITRQVDTSRLLIDALSGAVKQLASDLATSIQTTQGYETYLANKLRAYGGRLE